MCNFFKLPHFEVLQGYLQSQVIGVYFISAISLSEFSIIAILYVDDSDVLITATQKDEFLFSIFNRTQRAATIYQSAVHQIGGPVRLDKYRWHLMQLDKWSYLKNDKTNTFKIMDTNHNAQPLHQLSVDHRWKGLSILLSPEGNWNDHTKYLIDEKFIPRNNAISTSYLYKNNIYCAATTSIFKTIDYSLAATFMYNFTKMYFKNGN